MRKFAAAAAAFFVLAVPAALAAPAQYSVDPGGGGYIAPGDRCQSWQNGWHAWYQGYLLTCRYYGPTYGWMWWY